MNEKTRDFAHSSAAISREHHERVVHYWPARSGAGVGRLRRDVEAFASAAARGLRRRPGRGALRRPGGLRGAAVGPRDPRRRRGRRVAAADAQLHARLVAARPLAAGVAGVGEWWAGRSRPRCGCWPAVPRGRPAGRPGAAEGARRNSPAALSGGCVPCSARRPYRPRRRRSCLFWPRVWAWSPVLRDAPGRLRCGPRCADVSRSGHPTLSCRLLDASQAPPVPRSGCCRSPTSTR